MYAQLTPDSDGALANGLLHVTVRDKLIGRGLIAARVAGSLPLHTLPHPFGQPDPPHCGRSTYTHRTCRSHAGRSGGRHGAAPRGSEQQRHGIDSAVAFVNLAVPQCGKAFAGCSGLTDQGKGKRPRWPRARPD